MGKLHFAIYVSKANESFDNDALNTLVYKSKKKNKQKSITGFLYFGNGYFLQYIETFDINEIELLIETLNLDNRHTIIQSFISLDTIERRFNDWGMRWVLKEQLIELKLEQEILDYIKWLSNDMEISKYSSPKIWSLVDTFSAHKIQLDSLLENF